MGVVRRNPECALDEIIQAKRGSGETEKPFAAQILGFSVQAARSVVAVKFDTPSDLGPVPPPAIYGSWQRRDFTCKTRRHNFARLRWRALSVPKIAFCASPLLFARQGTFP